MVTGLVLTIIDERQSAVLPGGGWEHTDANEGVLVRKKGVAFHKARAQSGGDALPYRTPLKADVAPGHATGAV